MFEVDDSGTFMGVPAAALGDLDDVDVAIIGAPCATPYGSIGPYSKDAPAAIRSASKPYSRNRHHHNFDLDGEALGSAARVVDLGDVEWSATDFEANRSRIREACAAVLNAGAVPVVFGGDDSIPIPVVQAYADRGPLTIVQIDAHIDWRDEVQGERWGLSSTMRRSSELAHVGEMIQIGQRGVGSARPSDVADAKARGVHLFSAHEVHRNGVAAAVERVPRGGNVLITIDADGLDPAVIPAVLAREPGGLSYFEAIEIIDGVAARATIAGFDIVEVVPDVDVSGIGALTAFRLAAHAIGRIAGQRASATATA
jgi:agmatinase